MKAHALQGPPSSVGSLGLVSLLFPALHRPQFPGEKSGSGATVDCTEGQGGEGVRREGGTGDSDPWNRVAQRDSSTPVPSPVALSLLFFAALDGGREDV